MVFIAGYQVSTAKNRRHRRIESQQLKQSWAHRGIPSQKRKESSSSRDSKSAAQTIVVIAG
ncbi:hypothetical protein DPMN_182020 [Dreissena polymorpha]|uniref:Uncharacterized protein n=1 Tax=Dreissena polymorpha TaxID=45954 RepID=A0A9D4DGC6_DREPO|nr:hypothetical protein DPMN_182020 [Dreissena polymorpha]